MKKTKEIKIYTKCFKLPDQIFFAQRLSLLLNSGISTVEALYMMKNIDGSVYRKRIYEILIQNLEQGISLGKTIKKTGLRLNSLLIILIQNGEEGGHLPEALIRAYNFLDKKNDINKKIISSLVYPFFIVIATIIMTLFLILYIFPKIIPLLQSLDIKLPLITRIVQGLYYFLISYGIYTTIFVSISFFVVRVGIKKSQKIKRILDKGIVSLPLVNSYIKIYLMSSVCNIAEMFLSSGKALPDVLIFSRDSLRNSVYKNIFNEMHTESMRGVPLSISLKKYRHYFPPLMSDMCALGERTGNLALMLGHCAAIFEQDIDNALKRFSSLIEPVLMVLMGLIVGSIALSIILPVYEITNHLSK